MEVSISKKIVIEETLLQSTHVNNQ